MNKEISFPAKVVAFLAIVSAFVAAFWFIGKISIIFLYFSVAIIISFILNPFVDWLERRRIPRALSIIAMFTIFAGLAALAIILLVPRIADQIEQLTSWIAAKAKTMDENTITGYIKNARDTLERWGFSRKYLAWVEESVANSGVIEKAVASLQETGAGIAKNAVGSILGFISYIPGLIVIPVLVFYFLKDARKMRESFIASLPERWRADADSLITKLSKAIGGFITGQAKLCSAIGILAGAAMAIIGMPYALIMGVIAGAFEFIPYLGPILGMIMPVIVAAFIGWKMVLIVIAIFFGIQMIENNILAPRIMSADVGMHPVLIIFILIAGGEAGGIPGMLAALPVAVMLKALYVHFYIEKCIRKPEGPAADAVAVEAAVEAASEPPDDEDQEPE